MSSIKLDRLTDRSDVDILRNKANPWMKLVTAKATGTERFLTCYWGEKLYNMPFTMFQDEDGDVDDVALVDGSTACEILVFLRGLTNDQANESFNLKPVFDLEDFNGADFDNVGWGYVDAVTPKYSGTFGVQGFDLMFNLDNNDSDANEGPSAIVHVTPRNFASSSTGESALDNCYSMGMEEASGGLQIGRHTSEINEVSFPTFNRKTFLGLTLGRNTDINLPATTRMDAYWRFGI